MILWRTETDPMSDLPCTPRPEKCLGCGHRLLQHRLYADSGMNRHGSRLVCIADNCHYWQDCHEHHFKTGSGPQRLTP